MFIILRSIILKSIIAITIEFNMPPPPQF